MTGEDAQTRRLPLLHRRRRKETKSDAVDGDSDSAPPPQPRVGPVTSPVIALWLPEIHEEQCVVYGAGNAVVFEGLKEVTPLFFFFLPVFSFFD